MNFGFITADLCLVCFLCSRQFESGDLVTYTGKDYLCSSCLETASSVTATPLLGTEQPEITPLRAPVATSTPGRAGERMNGAVNGINGAAGELTHNALVNVEPPPQTQCTVHPT